MYAISISSSFAARYALSPYLATICHHHQPQTFSKPSNSYWTYSFRSVPTMIVKNHSKKYISIQLTKPNQSNYCWAGCLALECLHIALQRLWLNMRYPAPISPTPHCRHCLQQQNTLDLTEFICPSFFSPYIYTNTLFAYLIFFAIQRIFSCFCCNFFIILFLFF